MVTFEAVGPNLDRYPTTLMISSPMYSALMFAIAVNGLLQKEATESRHSGRGAAPRWPVGISDHRNDKDTPVRYAHVTSSLVAGSTIGLPALYWS